MNLHEAKISRLDYELIERIKVLRKHKGWSQRVLSAKMGLSLTFVGKVESLGQPEKYSIRHLTLLANAFNLENFNELFPKNRPSEDMVIITYRKEQKLKKDGTPSQFFEEVVVKIKAVKK